MHLQRNIRNNKNIYSQLIFFIANIILRIIFVVVNINVTVAKN